MLNPVHQNFTKEPALQRRKNISFGTKIDPSLKNFVNRLIHYGDLNHDVVDLLSEIAKDGQSGNLFIRNGKIALKVQDIPIPMDEYLNASDPAVKKAIKNIEDFQDIDIVDSHSSKGINLYKMVEKPSIMNADGRYSFDRYEFYYALNPKRIKNIQERAKKLVDEYIVASITALFN